MLWSRREKMSITSSTCSQYWLLLWAVLTILLMMTCDENKWKNVLLERAKDWWRLPLVRVSNTVLSLDNLIPEFLLSEVCLLPFAPEQPFLQGSSSASCSRAEILLILAISELHETSLYFLPPNNSCYPQPDSLAVLSSDTPPAPHLSM